LLAGLGLAENAESTSGLPTKKRGKIHEIEAMGFTLPLYSRNGWSPFLR
jgi:hypothetical protein